MGGCSGMLGRDRGSGTSGRSLSQRCLGFQWVFGSTESLWCGCGIMSTRSVAINHLGILYIPIRLYLSSGLLMCFYVIGTKLVVDEVTEEGNSLNFVIILRFLMISHHRVSVPNHQFPPLILPLFLTSRFPPR